MDVPAPHHFAGLDWASDKHDLCVLDPAGKVCLHLCIRHTAEGLAELIRVLDRFGPRAQLPIAIERPSGLLVDTLVEAGFPVVPIHPNALKATRPRYSAAQGKSDPGDAFILADVLRTDGHRFRSLRAPSDQTRALRAAVRTRDDLVATRVQLANQLRSLLDSFWPGAVAIFADIDSPIALAFLDDFPSPESAAHLGEKRLDRFLKRHTYCGRRSPAELLTRLRAAPQGKAEALESETKGQLVRALTAVLRPLVQQIRDLGGLIDAHLQQHPDGPILQSFPRTGSVNAAQILAELGDDRLRFDSFEQLAAEAGVAPVTHTSGKHRGVSARFACNKRLRQALTTPGPTTLAMPVPGPPTCIDRRALVAAITRTPSASSPAPGLASSGAAGTTIRPTTPKATEGLSPSSLRNPSRSPLESMGLTQGVSQAQGEGAADARDSLDRGEKPF